ncbi:unnamed protein product [Oikopleura dioica]|uniref:DZF domain-containing protein n=1 Tax=Oikopleura dioica TaxID=34765 RepID=E4XE44_OIKDI|nr:unnamed protein product [Oikopleura dioica]
MTVPGQELKFRPGFRPEFRGPAPPPRNQGPRGPRPQAFIPHIPFDFFMSPDSFPVAVDPECEAARDLHLEECLIQKNDELLPTETLCRELALLANRVCSALEELIVNPGEGCPGIEDVKVVGSFKKGTMLNGSVTADVVAQLRSLPTHEVVQRLSRRVLEEMRAIAGYTPVTLLPNETGFEISSTDCSVRVMVGTAPENLNKLEPGLHLEKKYVSKAVEAVKHANWFEIEASDNTIRTLVRIIKDLKARYKGMDALSPWMIDLICHHAVLSNPLGESLSLPKAFRRLIQVLAGGIFLPGSVGLTDPCASGPYRIHTTLSLEEQDGICMTAQTLLRALAHGAVKRVLGMEEEGIINDVLLLDEVTVIPSERVFMGKA